MGQGGDGAQVVAASQSIITLCESSLPLCRREITFRVPLRAGRDGRTRRGAGPRGSIAGGGPDGAALGSLRLCGGWRGGSGPSPGLRVLLVRIGAVGGVVGAAPPGLSLFFFLFFFLLVLGLTVGQLPQSPPAAFLRAGQQHLLGRFVLSSSSLLLLSLLCRLLLRLFAALPFHAAVLEPNLHLETGDNLLIHCLSVCVTLRALPIPFFFFFFPFLITTIFPYFSPHLRLGEHQRRGHLEALGPGEVLVELELVLQLQQLLAGEGGARPPALPQEVGLRLS